MVNSNPFADAAARRAQANMSKGPQAPAKSPDDGQAYSATDMSAYNDRLAALDPDALISIIDEMGASMPSDEFDQLLAEHEKPAEAEPEPAPEESADTGAQSITDKIASAVKASRVKA